MLLAANSNSFHHQIALFLKSILLISCCNALAQTDILLQLDSTPQVVSTTTVTLSGSLTPTDATLNINGQSISVQPDGSFSNSVALNPGTNMIRFEATATGYPALNQIIAIISDLSPPSIAITTPSMIHYTNLDQVSVTGRVSDQEDRELSIFRDSTLLSVGELLFQDPSVNLDTSSDRTTTTFIYRVEDRVGQSATQILTVHRKTTTPQVNLTLTPQAVLPGQDFDVSLQLDSNDEITGVEVRVGGDLVYTGQDASPFNQSFTAPQDVRSIPVQVTVEDRYGNTTYQQEQIRVLEPTYVFGTVRDHSNSHGMAGVTVTFDSPNGSQTLQTDEEGRFQLFTHGDVDQVSINHPGYAPVVRNNPTHAKSWRVADLRLTQVSPHAGQAIKTHSAAITFSNAAAGLQIATIGTQNLTSLLPPAFTPLGGVHVANAGSTIVNLTNDFAQNVAGHNLVWLRKDAQSPTFEVVQKSTFSANASYNLSGLTEGTYLLAATSNLSVTAGTLLKNDQFTTLGTGFIPEAEAFPARVSLLDNPETQFTIRVNNPEGTLPSRTLAQTFYREVHDRYAGRVLLTDQTVDIWLHDSLIDNRLIGSVKVATRLDVTPEMTRRATIDFQAQAGPTEGNGLELIDTLKFGELTLFYAQAADQTLAKSLTHSPLNTIPTWQNSEVLGVFNLHVAAITQQSPELTYSSSNDAIKMIVLRHKEGTDWVYAGSLSRKGSQWTAQSSQIDMRTTATYAVVALNHDISEIRGSVTAQGQAISHAVLRHGNHPFLGESGSLALNTEGVYRFFVPQQPTPDDTFLERLPYLYTVTATDPATNKKGSTIVSSTVNTPYIRGVNIELDDASFALVNHKPYASEIGVKLMPEISLEFDQRLTDDVLARANGVTLSGPGGSIPFEHYLSVNGRTMHITPRVTLNETTQYTVSVNSALEDRFGNPAAPTAFNFTTLTKAILPDLVLTKFFVEPRGDEHYLVGPAGSFPAGTELQIVMGATADAFTQIINGTSYERLLTNYAEGDAIYLFATAPNGDQASHTLDLIKLADNRYKLGTRPFSVDVDANTTLHISSISGDTGEEVTISKTSTTENQQLTQSLPLYESSGWNMAYGIRVTPTDTDALIHFEGTIEIAGLPALPEGQAYMIANIQEGIMAPASPYDLDNMVSHNVARIVGQLGDGGTNGSGKRFLTGLATFGFTSFGPMGLFGGEPSYAHMELYSQIPADLYPEAEKALPGVVYTADNPNRRWHQKARESGFVPYGPAWAWGTHSGQEIQNWVFLGTTNPDCEIQSTHPTNAFGTMTRIEAIDRWKGGRVTPSFTTLDFGYNDLEGRIEIEESLKVKWSVVQPEDPEDTSLPGVPSMGAFNYIVDEAATREFRDFRRIVKVSGMALKAEISAGSTSKSFQKASLLSPSHPTQTVNLNGTAPQAFYFPLALLDTGQDHNLGIDFDFATHPSQLFEASFSLLSGLDDDLNAPGPPTIVGVFPADGEKDVDSYPWLQFAFSESVKNIPGNITLRDLTTDATIELDFLDATYQQITAADKLAANFVARPKEVLKLEREYEIRIEGVTDRNDNAFEWQEKGSIAPFSFFTSIFKTTEPKSTDLDTVEGGNFWFPNAGRRLNNLILSVNRVADSAQEIQINVYDIAEDQPRKVSATSILFPRLGMTQPFFVDFFTPEEMGEGYAADDFRAQNQKLNQTKYENIPDGTFAVITLDHTVGSDKMYFFVFMNGFFNYLGESGLRNGPKVSDQVKMGPFLAISFISANNFTFAQTYDIRDYFQLFQAMGGLSGYSDPDGWDFTRQASEKQPSMILPVPGNPSSLASFTWREVDSDTGTETMRYGLAMSSQEYPAIFGFDPALQGGQPATAFGKTRNQKTAGPLIYDPQLIVPTDYSQLSQGRPTWRQNSGVAEGLVVPTLDDNTRIADVAVFKNTDWDTRISDLLFYVLPTEREASLKAADLVYTSQEEILSIEIDRSSGQMALVAKENGDWHLIVVDLTAVLKEGLGPDADPVDVLGDQFITFKKKGFYESVYFDGETIIASRFDDQTLEVIEIGNPDYRESGWLVVDLGQWMSPAKNEGDEQLKLRHHKHQVFYATDKVLPENASAPEDLELYLELGTFEIDVKPREVIDVTLRSSDDQYVYRFPSYTNKESYSQMKSYTPHKVRDWINSSAQSLRENGYRSFELEITTTFMGQPQYREIVPFYYAYRMPTGAYQDPQRFMDNYDVVSQTPHFGMELYNLSTIDPRLNLSPRILIDHSAQFKAGGYGVGTTNAQMLQMGMPVWWDLDGANSENPIDLNKAFPRFIFQQPEVFEVEVSLDRNGSEIEPTVRQGLGSTFERNISNFWTLTHRGSMRYTLNSARDLPDYHELYLQLNKSDEKLKDARFPVFRFIPEENMPGNMTGPAILASQIAEPYKNMMLFQHNSQPSNRPTIAFERTADEGSGGRAVMRSYSLGGNRAAVRLEQLPNRGLLVYTYDANGYLTKIEGSHPETIEFEWEAVEGSEPMGTFSLKRLKRIIFEEYEWVYNYVNDKSLRLSSVNIPHFGSQALITTPGAELPGLPERVSVSHAGLEISEYGLSLVDGAMLINNFKRGLLNNNITWSQVTNETQVSWFPTQTSEPAQTFAYDDLGRLIQKTDAFGQWSWSYHGGNYLDEKQSQTNPLGEVTTYGIDRSQRTVTPHIGSPLVVNLSASGSPINQKFEGKTSGAPNSKFYTPSGGGFIANAIGQSIETPLQGLGVTAFEGSRYNAKGGLLNGKRNGQRTLITYDAFNRPTEIRLGSGEHQTIDYVGDNGLLTIRTTHYPSKNEVTETFNHAGQLVSRISESYDSKGTPSTKTEALSYDKYSRITLLSSLDDINGERTRSYSYIGETSAISIYGDYRRGSSLQIVNRTNGSTPAITSRTIIQDNKAVDVTYQTDILGRVTATELDGAGAVTMDFDGWGRTTSVVSNGSATAKKGELLFSRQYGDGQITTVDNLAGTSSVWTQNDSHGTSWSYTQELDGFEQPRTGVHNVRVDGVTEDLGYVFTQSSGLSDLTEERSFFPGGSLIKETRSMGGHSSGWEGSAFDIYGTPLNLRDVAIGRSSSLTAADNGAITGVRNLLNLSTTSAKDALGRTTQLGLPNGQVWNNSYKDSATLGSTTVTDPVLGNTQILNQTDSWQSSSTHPLGRITQQAQDIVADTYTATSTVSDPVSNINESETLNFDRPSGLPTNYTDFSGENYSFSFANHGREVTLTNPTTGLTETRKFDALGNLRSRSVFGGTSSKQAAPISTSFDYDIYGRPKSITKGADTTNFAFKPNGFLQSVKNLDKTIHFRKHEPTGAPTSIELPDSSTVEVDYYEDGRTVHTITSLPVDGKPSHYEFDKFGNLTSMQEDGRNCITFNYSGWGFPTSLSTAGESYLLSDAATPNLLTLPGGVEIEVDGVGQEYRRSFPGVADHIYERDGNGQLRQVTVNGSMAIGLDYNGPYVSRQTLMQSDNGPVETIDFSYIDTRIAEKNSNLYGSHVFQYQADFPDALESYSRNNFDYNFDLRSDGLLDNLAFGTADNQNTFFFDYDDRGNQSMVSFRDFSADFENYENGLPETIEIDYAGKRHTLDIQQEGGFFTGYSDTTSGEVPLAFTLETTTEEFTNNEGCSQFESSVRIPTRAVKQTDVYIEAILTSTREDRTLANAEILRAAGDLNELGLGFGNSGSGQASKRSAGNDGLLSDIQSHDVATPFSLTLDVDLDGNADLNANVLVRRHLHGRSDLLQTVEQQLAALPGDDQLLIQAIYEDYGSAANALMRAQLKRDLLIFNLEKVGANWHGTVDYYPMDVLTAQADSNAYQGRVDQLTITRPGGTDASFSFGYDTFGNIDGIVDQRSGKESVVFDGSRRINQIATDGFTYDAFNRRVNNTDSGIQDNLTYAYHDSRPIAIGYANGNDVRWEYVIVHGPLGALFLYDMNDRDGVDRSYLVYTDHLGTPWAYRSMATGQIYHHSTAPWGDLNHNATPGEVYDGLAAPHAMQVASGIVPATSDSTTGGALKLFETPNFGNLDNFLGLSSHIRDRTGLLYMHNRYYDPMLGHFLTPDFRAPDIYDPSTFTEPYAYAAGNPFMFWDPNGLVPLIIDNPTFRAYYDNFVNLLNNTWEMIAGSAEGRSKDIYTSAKATDQFIKLAQDNWTYFNDPKNNTHLRQRSEQFGLIMFRLLQALVEKETYTGTVDSTIEEYLEFEKLYKQGKVREAFAQSGSLQNMIADIGTGVLSNPKSLDFDISSPDSNSGFAFAGVNDGGIPTPPKSAIDSDIGLSLSRGTPKGSRQINWEKLAEFKWKTFESLDNSQRKIAETYLDRFKVQFASGTGTPLRQIRNVRKLIGDEIYEIKTTTAGIRIYIDKHGNVLGYGHKNQQSKHIQRLRNLLDI